jgi:restriction system protein
VTIPDYQTIMLPLLRLLSDGKEYSLQEARHMLADQFTLSEDERQQLQESGRYTTFSGRVSWASTYLKEAGLIERPRRAYMKITARGRSVLEEDPARIDVKLLDRHPEFVAFRKRSRKRSVNEEVRVNEQPDEQVNDQSDDLTPEEAIKAAYQTVRDSLIVELLQQIKGCSPEFFERLVVDLLVKMGYGGTRAEAGKAVGKSGDGGIDGIINEDRLGLDVIYIQAKRWENTIGRPDIQQFAGALQGQKARKGVFITTSGFSKAAIEYAHNIESSIILVDGETLAGLMIDHDVGVALQTSYEIKRIDSDYFEEL